MLKGEEARAAIQIQIGSHGVIINASKSHIMPIFAQWHREIFLSIFVILRFLTIFFLF